MHWTAYLQIRMILVVSPGLLVLLKAQTYLNFYCLGTNLSCASYFNIQSILSINTCRLALACYSPVCLLAIIPRLFIFSFTYMLREF